MYKLIIVEDENIVRSGLEHGTDWAGLGFEVAGTATNGIEALKLVEQCNPDVVLTDIRMPDMNGIELMRILRNQYADVEIVILSGYSDFEYARSAVKYKAYEYLTKPIDEQELIKTFQSIKQKIRSKRQELYTQKDSENGLYRVDRVKLRDVFLSTFMRKPLDEEFIRKSLVDLDIRFNEKCYCIAVVQLDFDNQAQLDAVIEEQFSRKISQRLDDYPYVFSDKIYHILLSKSTTTALYDFIKEMEHLKETLFEDIGRQNEGISIGIGLSKLHSGFNHVVQALNEALSALQLKFYMGDDQVITYSNLNDMKPEDIDNGKFEELAAKLVEAVADRNSADRGRYTNQLFEYIRNTSLVDVTYIRIKFMEIFVLLDNKLRQKEIHLKQLASKDSLYAKIFSKGTLQALKRWFDGEIEQIEEEYTRLYAEKSNNLLTQVNQYIYDNISEKIYLNDIAAAVHMSPNYLSAAFTKETGLNLSKYIIDLRIKKAKEYLAQSDMRIQEISDVLGFSDYRYFSTLFKKETGQTPLDYRSMHHK